MKYLVTVDMKENIITGCYTVDDIVTILPHQNEEVFEISKEQTEQLNGRNAKVSISGESIKILEIIDIEHLPESVSGSPKTSDSVLLKQEIADQAFHIMLLENEIAQQKQYMADLEFNLMMGGLI